MGKGASYPRRHAVPGTFSVEGVWTGGGAAADMTVTSGDWNRGITSIKYNSATGKYKITFRDFGQQVIGFNASVAAATGVDPLIPVKVTGTYDKSLGTMELEITTPAGTLTDLPTTSKMRIEVIFADGAPPA